MFTANINRKDCQPKFESDSSKSFILPLQNSSLRKEEENGRLRGHNLWNSLSYKRKQPLNRTPINRFKQSRSQ